MRAILCSLHGQKFRGHGISLVLRKLVFHFCAHCWRGKRDACESFMAKIALMLIFAVCFSCNHDPVFAQTSRPPVELHYSPAEDLENIDLWNLDMAQKSVDISTYAMDDRPIAEELVKLAQRGVVIRIYRDQIQYEGELAHGKRKEGSDLNQLFAGQANIHVRVKGTVALAHIKAYVIDDKLLREGSANWSVSGLKVQDNSLILISSPNEVLAFERNFSMIWDRPGNRVIQ
jgi:phosphatidylserine/phosphatidylglycerophosphate/cardiolipin synthase-like enzyme